MSRALALRLRGLGPWNAGSGLLNGLALSSCKELRNIPDQGEKTTLGHSPSEGHLNLLSGQFDARGFGGLIWVTLTDLLGGVLAFGMMTRWHRLGKEQLGRSWHTELLSQQVAEYRLRCRPTSIAPTSPPDLEAMFIAVSKINRINSGIMDGPRCLKNMVPCIRDGGRVSQSTFLSSP